ncbi:MAG: FAD-dependent oxidoreductase [Oscillospiraceae bacterium]|nr:FAD-dependent oxidoreductase [Oscillospiraceae bacterium]
MTQKYQSLLSPIKINDVVLRNRLIVTPSNPHFVQSTEKWPTEALITHYANKAKSGAAIVTCKGNNPVKTADVHSQSLDITNGAHQHMFAQMAEAVHFYGAKASYLVLPNMNIVAGYDASDGILSEFVAGDGSKAEYGKAAPKELLYEMVEEYAKEAKLAKNLGFDMCYLHMAYRMMFPGRFLSPLSNQRTDEFGGSIANRARFPLMICEAIKKACGKNFLIEISISGREDDTYPNGATVQDQIELAKLCAGKVDILQIRGGAIDPSACCFLVPEDMPHRESAAAIRKGLTEAGVQNVYIDLVGGCQDLDLCEEVIEKGEADFIGGARTYIADPEFGVKAYEGRGEDVVSCLRCNKCHIPGPEKWNTVCSVNPVFGIEHKVERMVSAPSRKKKIAVVGGGPAGMQAAQILKRRGHDVTLYDEAGELGGMLKTMAPMGLKWRINMYREYMAEQTYKCGVNVVLNTRMTPEMIDAIGYDDVLLALGADPARPPVPGADRKNVMFAAEAALRENELGHNLVIVGGGEVGVEMGIHLARKGHEVTVVEMLGMLSPESVPVHFRSMLEQTWENQQGFHYILNAVCTGIFDEKITYKKDGIECELPADNVLLAAGFKARGDEAMSFFTGKARTWMIGSCETPGSIQSANRSAFGVANNI